MRLIIPQDFTQELTITSFDSDRERRLRMSSQMKLQQEVGELHLMAGDLPYAKLYDEMGKVWVLTRTRAVIKKSPVFEEKVRLTTWSKQIKGAQFFRSYEFRDLDGGLFISAISSFALVDAHTHEVLRPTVLEDDVEFSCVPDREQICGLPSRVRIEGEKIGSFQREIRYSDIDYNHHLNNTVYCDFMVDYFPLDLSRVKIDEFEINYLKEGMLGDTLIIDVYRSGDTVYYEGVHDRGCCFTARAVFSEISES